MTTPDIGQLKWRSLLVSQLLVSDRGQLKSDCLLVSATAADRDQLKWRRLLVGQLPTEVN